MCQEVHRLVGKSLKTDKDDGRIWLRMYLFRPMYSGVTETTASTLKHDICTTRIKTCFRDKMMNQDLSMCNPSILNKFCSLKTLSDMITWTEVVHFLAFLSDNLSCSFGSNSYVTNWLIVLYVKMVTVCLKVSRCSAELTNICYSSCWFPINLKIYADVN